MSTDDTVLADTSIWVDYIDHSDTTLRGLLEDGRMLMHPANWRWAI